MEQAAADEIPTPRDKLGVYRNGIVDKKEGVPRAVLPFVGRRISAAATLRNMIASTVIESFTASLEFNCKPP